MPSAGNARTSAACPRDVSDAAHELLVLALRIVDDGDRGPRDGGELRGFTGMVHSQLDGGRGVAVAKAEDRERQADRVVEVAFGRQHAHRTTVGAQNRRQHLLHGRLAVAADNDQDGKVEPGAPVRGQLAERDERIWHRDAIARKRVRAVRATSAAGRRALSSSDEIVAVEPFP
jgi:hypothetical protein